MVAEISREEEEQFDIIFPDDRVFRVYVRMMSIPYGVQAVKRGMGGLTCCGLDAEMEESQNFREMKWDERAQALREMTWEPAIAVWLLPWDHRSTISDLLARRKPDLDLKAPPFTYTADDWKSAWFRKGWSSFLSANDHADWERVHACSREEKIAYIHEWLDAWHPKASDANRDMRPHNSIDVVGELTSMAWDEQSGWLRKQLAVSGVPTP